jgi:dCTP deaminase
MGDFMTLSKMYGHARPLIDTDYKRCGRDLISPFDEARIQPASYDVTLGNKLLVPNPQKEEFDIDLRSGPTQRGLKPSEAVIPLEMSELGFRVDPGGCVLAATAEMVTCPADMICSVDGKSTLGRCFIAIHATAGFIDPGFVGVVTLEITNHSPWAFWLYPGMPIGQLRFHWLNMQVERPYGSPGLGSHYQGALSVAPAAPPQE